MNHTVLLVDDDVNLLEALGRQLHGEPYRIITAQSGQEALAVLNDTSVDVVISDQEMPGMKGTQFLWQVKRAFPDAILFMLTGKATLRAATLAMNEVGVARFFVKPCNAVDLVLTIRQALQHRALTAFAKRLLKKVKQQDAILAFLEQESPGITQVKTDSRGIVRLDEDDPADCDALIEELRSWLGEKENGNGCGERVGR
ncbi:MAG: response regulator [Nitrospiraceae bacterium]|nr:response regulator [Nitrospiraceae bacterium]